MRPDHPLLSENLNLWAVEIRPAHAQDTASTSVTLTVSAGSQNGERVRLVCTGVRNLRVQELYMHGGSPLLAVEDVSERQWEDIRFEIYDFETAMISFVCAEIEVVEPA